MLSFSCCRGGVLEPEGLVEVKYKKKDLLKTMHRLDYILIELEKTHTLIKEQIAQHPTTKEEATDEGKSDKIIIRLYFFT